MSLLGSNDIKPYNEQVLTQNRITGGDITNQTNLLALADLKRQQETQAQLRAFYQQNPQMLLGEQSPQSTLGSLQTAPPGVMTDTLMRPGQPPQTQVVPPPMFGPGAAAPPGTTMPQTTLGGLAAPQQANPLLALAQSNPEAAMAVRQRQSQMQEQRLTMGTKVMEYIGRIAQSVKSQEDLDQARSEIARVSPQAAAQLPQSYSSDAMAPFIAKALDVKEAITLRTEQARIQALLRGQDVDLAKLQQQGGKLNYQTDAQGNIVAVPEFAGGTGGVQSRPVLGPDGQPIKSLEGQKLTADQQKQVRTQEGELRTHVDTLLKPYYEVRDAIGRIEASATSPDSAGDLALITAYMKMLDPTTGVRDMEFRNAENIGGFVDRIKTRLANWASGDRLIDETRTELLDRARRLYQQYEKDYGQVKQQYRDLTTRLGGNPANVVLESGSTAAKAPVQIVTRNQLQEWATQRSKDLGRPVTVEEVAKDVKARGFRVE